MSRAEGCRETAWQSIRAKLPWPLLHEVPSPHQQCIQYSRYCRERWCFLQACSQRTNALHALYLKLSGDSATTRGATVTASAASRISSPIPSISGMVPLSGPSCTEACSFARHQYHHHPTQIAAVPIFDPFLEALSHLPTSLEWLLWPPWTSSSVYACTPASSDEGHSNQLLREKSQCCLNHKTSLLECLL